MTRGARAAVLLGVVGAAALAIKHLTVALAAWWVLKALFTRRATAAEVRT
jgi:hypothetical protein